MPRLLDRIDNPADLKGLTKEELEQLAAEIRQELVRSNLKPNGFLLTSLSMQGMQVRA